MARRMTTQMPVDGVAGSLWRAATTPIRLVAPAVSVASRFVCGRYWSETEQRVPGTGPEVDMTPRPDIQEPRDGAGPLNHRTYRARVAGSQRSPEAVIDALRQRPNNFSPTSFATFEPSPGPHGLSMGDEVTVRLPGPWDGPVVVTGIEPGLMKLETLESHMEAGWIRFSAALEQAELVIEIESFARSGDPVFDALYHPGRIARLIQTEMWVRVLEGLVRFSGGTLLGRVAVDTTIYEGANS